MGIAGNSDLSKRESAATSTAVPDPTDESVSESDQNMPVVDLPAHYTLIDTKDNAMLEESDCKVSVCTQLLAIESTSGERHEFAYREIVALRPQEYALNIILDGLSFSLDQLGDKYDDLKSFVFNLRNNQCVRDLLVDEGQPSASVRGVIEYSQGERKTLVQSPGRG